MSAWRVLLCASSWVVCLFSAGVHSATPSLSAGGSHNIILKNDGTVRTWGSDGVGQLGIGRLLKTSTPISPQIFGVKAIEAGYAHTVALKGDGTVLAWGRNINGLLGDGTETQRAAPVQVSGLKTVVAISAGDYHSVALKGDGTVWAWGRNVDGELGIGTNTDSWIPVQVQLFQMDTGVKVQ